MQKTPGFDTRSYVKFTLVNLIRSLSKNIPKKPVAPVNSTRPLIHRREFLKFPERQNALNMMSMLSQKKNKKKQSF